MHTPVLIIGSGLSGLITAYRLAESGVSSVILTKSSIPFEETNSVYAQGGIIYQSDQGDPESLISDILNAGDKINFSEAVEQLANDGPDYVRNILMDQVRVPFDQENGQFSLTSEAAHSLPRIVHVKDFTGRAIMQALWDKIHDNPLIQVLSSHVLVDLLTSGHNCRGYRYKYFQNRCLGAYVFDIQSSKVKTILADYTVLCTGGIGQLYEYHTNADHSYGSGLAVANRARVRIINSRFVQFHPTSLWTPKKGRRFLISEALRGEGARLMNKKEEYLMDEYPEKDLSSRAVVSRVIMEYLQNSDDNCVYLDLSRHYSGSIPIQDRFPSIYETCLKEGIDITKEPIPVVPAEHFFCGGVFTDLHGQTELPGLFAAGEVACTGLHGANRLASTSLLECLTWGVKSADRISSFHENRNDDESVFFRQAYDLIDDWESFGTECVSPQKIERQKDQIRHIMWEKVGVLRKKERLFEARDELRALWRSIDLEYSSHALSESLIELRHMVEAAYLITLSASSHTSLKEDSLGGHVLRG